MTLETQIRQIKNHIKEKTRHPYLDQFIEKPQMDEDKIKMLIKLFDESGRYKQVDYYVTAVMIMQMALDIHDFVDNENLPGTGRSKQLSVLAGDYYSSLYYCMLSEKQAFPMIRSLAEGIRVLNEEKVNFFRGKWEWDSFIDLMKKIETSLIVGLAEFLGLLHWSPFISAYFTYKRIAMEMHAAQDGPGSVFMKPFFQKEPERKQQFIDSCEDWLSGLKEQMESEIRSNRLNQKMLRIFEPIWKGKEPMLSPNKLVEEGF
ncbi:MAG: heptaprenyl diphosphate synthase component 1 [Tuberibacillus sp.]